MKNYVDKSIFATSNTRNDIMDYTSKIAILREELKQESITIDKGQKHIASAINSYNTVKTELSLASTGSNKSEKAMEFLHDELMNMSETYSLIIQERETYPKKLDAIEYEYEKICERLQDLFGLAGLGLSAEMFAHEFDSSTRSIISKNQKILSPHKQMTVDDLLKHIHYITHLMEALRKQMSYFNPGLKYVRAEKQLFAISDFLKSHQLFFKERFEKQGIEPTLDMVVDFNVSTNRGLLSQVFDNLVSNSEYWLEFSHKAKYIKNKKFFISIPERGIIVVWDNGIGISKDIERRLFEPFESKKPNGRGLGLYIAANNLQYYSARIRLLGQRNSEGNLYKFEIDLSQVTE